MESAIKYVIVVTYGGKPNIIVANHSNQLKQLHRWLVQEKQDNPAFYILTAQRYVIDCEGQVIVTDIRIDFDEGGLRIFDKYGTLIDQHFSTYVMYEYEVERRETWVNRMRHRARIDDDAVKATEQDVADGTFDVMEGWLEDAETVIISKKPVKEGE